MCYIVSDGVTVISNVEDVLYSAEYGLPVFRIADPPKHDEIFVIFDFLLFFFYPFSVFC